ncbi:MAG: immune inhibitor A domain-containing protein [Nocardioides sp.]
MRPHPHAPRLRRAATVALAVALISGATSAIGTATGSAAPATTPSTAAVDLGPILNAVTQVLRQPGGHRFRATMTDIAVGGLFETADGFTVERDDAGVWRYVTALTSDGGVRLGVPVSAAPAPVGLVPQIGRRSTTLSAGEQVMRSAMATQLEAMAERLAPQAQKAAASPRVFYVPALMLATWYDEAKGETMPQFHGPTDTVEYFTKLLDGFGGNPYGSMTQFYYESSFGQFLVRVDVYGTFTSALSIPDPCYYGSPEDGSFKINDPAGGLLGVGGVGALGMAIEAVPQAVTVPWGKYDNDGDGVVDFTMIIHSGGGHEVTSDPCNTHSHAITASDLANIGTGLLGIDAETLKVGIPTSTPGVFVNRVVTIPEYESDVDPLTIGVATHEMAHAIGEPDYYDVTGDSVGLGDWDIMAGGSYMGNPSGSNPAMNNPATRVFQKYVTPTIVRKSLRNYTLKPRTALPKKGYRFGQPDRNLLLVPTYEIKVGQKDKLGHVWDADDVYGLAYDKATKMYVVEGFYLENVSRNARSVSLDPRNPRGSMFDRQMHSSGLAVWHFDYWRQSSTYFGHDNNAQSDANRYQMDLEEFDQNDNTQEIQLNLARGNPADLLTAAATGITSGTHFLPPHTKAPAKSKPQKPVEISGTTTPLSAGTATFTVSKTAVNGSMDVTINSDLVGDCKLQLTDPRGKKSAELDSGGPLDAETINVKKPIPGTWTVTVADFLLCGSWSGRVIFNGGAEGSFTTFGSADTWSNWSKRPTGWAFTNVRGYGNGLDQSQEAGARSSDITLDVLDLGASADVSPGFVAGRRDREGGAASLNAGKKNVLQVPVFSNGGKAPGTVRVTVREAGKRGRVVTSTKVKLGAFERKYVSFSYRPRVEGPVALSVTVDPANKVKEGSERNQTQVTHLWAGPAKARVLVVDDDQTLAHERAIQGSLAALGIPYATYGAHPPYSVLKKYDAVVWSTSVDRYEGVLNTADRRAIQKYLDRGGRMLLSGNRMMDALTNPGSAQSPASVVSFGAHYFGVRTPAGNATYIVTQGKPEKVRGAGLLKRLSIATRPSPARQFVSLAGLAGAGPGAGGSVVRPFGKATAIARPSAGMLGAVTEARDPALIGVAVDGDAKHRRFKTAVLGWNIGDNESAAVTTQLLQRVMTRFGVRSGKPLQQATPLIYVNPVRDSVSGRKATITAVVLGRGTGTPTLHFRRHDRGGFYSVDMKPGSVRGTWIASIPGSAVTPDGVDYFIRAGSAQAPYGALGGQSLYYSIAVAMPEVARPMPVSRGGDGAN